jgi:hypothetical protein
VLPISSAITIKNQDLSAKTQEKNCSEEVSASITLNTKDLAAKKNLRIKPVSLLSILLKSTTKKGSSFHPKVLWEESGWITAQTISKENLKIHLYIGIRTIFFDRSILSLFNLSLIYLSDL